MTTYYVGSGGNDSNDGLSWANRFLTLNGAEDEPVAAGDDVYVGPGTYREMLVIDVSGSSGSEITYIGDTTGENTDGIGGRVRITGSDNDQTATRDHCVDNVGNYTYRVFRGFTFDTCASYVIDGVDDNWTIEDCIFAGQLDGGEYFIGVNKATPTGITIQRCLLTGGRGMRLQHTTTTAASSCLVQNCVFLGGYLGILFSWMGAWVIKNCSFFGGYSGISSSDTISSANTVYNSVFTGLRSGIDAGTSGDVTEDYNNFSGNNADLINVTPGSNSLAYTMAPATPAPLLSGYILPPQVLGMLSSWNQVKTVAGSSPASDDFYGVTRPTTNAKKSWGAVQFIHAEKETGTTYSGSAAAIKVADACRLPPFKVPVENASTTISVRVYREANYAGTNPQMIIYQPGQSPRTTTDVGSSGAWNELSDTFTPAASPGYVFVVLISNNTATSGSYATYFDKLDF